MTRIEEFQHRVAEQGKAVLGYTADIVEWSAKKNIDVAKDVAGFTVDQLRLPTKAKDFAHYRESMMDAYGEFGGVLKSHGKDYAEKIREVPAEVRDLFVPKKAKAKKVTAKKAPAKKAPARKKAKKATAKKATAKKATAKKAPVAKKPAPVVKKATPVVEKAESKPTV
jgi:hypothetical protein